MDRVAAGDLLAKESLEQIFSTSFVCVDKTATVEEAIKAMRQAQGCQDIFVTTTGDAAGEVVGWMADRDLLDTDD